MNSSWYFKDYCEVILSESILQLLKILSIIKDIDAGNKGLEYKSFDIDHFDTINKINHNVSITN